MHVFCYMYNQKQHYQRGFYCLRVKWPGCNQIPEKKLTLEENWQIWKFQLNNKDIWPPEKIHRGKCLTDISGELYLPILQLKWNNKF